MTAKHPILQTVSLIAAGVALAACGGGGGGGGSSTPGGGGQSGGSANSAPRFTGPTSFTFNENEAVSFTLSVADSDGDTITITDDTSGDGSLFILNAASGQVTANTESGAFNFENPLDVNGDNIYEQNITLSDGQASVTQTIRVTIQNVIEPPSYNGLTDFQFDENSITGVAIAVTDPDSRSLDISLSGLDAEDFTTENRNLLFNELPDFEAPNDSNADNVYEVTLSISNNEATIEEPITITINDVNEPPTCTQDANITFAENTTGEIFTFVGTDPEGDPHDFGSDIVVSASTLFQNAFSFNSDTGVVSLDVPIDFEAVTDKTGTISTTFGGSPCNVDFELTDVIGDVTSGVRVIGDFAAANSVGDIDGDGFTELWLAENGPAPAGYVVYGQALNGLMPAGDLALSAATPVADGVKLLANSIAGADEDEQILSAREVGDIDGDGFAELLLGVESTRIPTSRPIAYLVWGNTLVENSTGSLNLDDMTENEGLILSRANISETEIGFTAGDLDGDSLDDIVVGIPAGFDDPSNQGVFVVFGSYLKDVKSTGGFDINSMERSEVLQLSFDTFSFENLGANLTTISDIDGDGTDELMAAYDIGVASILGKDILMAKNGTDPAFIVTEEIQSFRQLAEFNRVPFDVEGDGIDDLLFSSVAAEIAVVEPGSTLDGGRTRSGETVDTTEFGVSTISLSGLGDLNGDGQDEFAIGASRQNEPVNTVNIINGADFVATPVFAGFDMDAISPGQGLIIEGISPILELSGEIVRADDYDQDGLNELTIISPGTNQAFILRGSDLNSGLNSGSIRIDLNPLFNAE
ncbi:MAG: hypothetical protein ABJO36_05840 [Litorimonas sp.]